MYKAALIGRDIGYTKSPEVHKAISDATGLDIEFTVRDVSSDGLKAEVERLKTEVDGFFVTKPYKTEIKKHLDFCETECGVNFVRTKDMRGFNTDGAGFMRALDKSFPDWRDNVNAALVLGAGGAAYSVAEALIKSGKKVYILNRTLMNAVKLCKTVGAEIYLNQPAELIVNATSLGLNGEDALASLCVIPQFKYAYDLIYTPPETPFMRRNAMAGAATQNGADMLLYQAIEGDAIMTGQELDVNDVFEKAKKLLG
ncbi:MAG: shikimate dehydrogenase [Clostridiales bacterium]|nr:shikimate dehydrogenase [Clostridiales bacterium]